MNLRVTFTLILCLLGSAARAESVPMEDLQYEESSCAVASGDFSSVSGMQIKVVSAVSNSTGYTGSVTLIHKNTELSIGKSTHPEILSMAKVPLSFRVHIFGKKGTITFTNQTTISRGNGSVKIRQAVLDMPKEPAKNLLCIYSSY